MTRRVIAAATESAQGGRHDQHRHHLHHPSPTPSISISQAYALADADRRNALVANAWNVDGELLDPPLEGRGHAEISALADVVLTHYAGPSVRAHHRGRLAPRVRSLRLGARRPRLHRLPSAASTSSEFDEAGKLRRIVGFFGPLEPVAD